MCRMQMKLRPGEPVSAVRKPVGSKRFRCETQTIVWLLIKLFESDASNAGDGFSLGAKLELNDDHQSARPIVAAVGC